MYNEGQGEGGWWWGGVYKMLHSNGDQLLISLNQRKIKIRRTSIDFFVVISTFTDCGISN